MSWETFDEIFSLPSVAKNDTCCRSFLAAPMDNIAVTLEITLALPQRLREYSTLTLLQKVEVYKMIFDNFKVEYKATAGSYSIEYHDNGNPHLHGYLTVSLHPNVYAYPTEELLRMFAKSIFLQCPRSVFKQFARADVNAYLKRFKSPLVTLNIKNVLSTEWVNYCNKNTLKD